MTDFIVDNTKVMYYNNSMLIEMRTKCVLYVEKIHNMSFRNRMTKGFA